MKPENQSAHDFGAVPSGLARRAKVLHFCNEKRYSQRLACAGAQSRANRQFSQFHRVVV